MKIEALYSWSRSVARVEYTIPKTGAYIDTHVTLWVGDVNRMVKYRLDTAISGTFFGQTAFGTEEMREDGEAAFQKWCGISGKEGRLSILNRGIYGGDFKNSTMRLSLLRTPIYSAHPIGERQIAPHDRYVKHMDMGERQFTFRITPTKNPDRAAEIYNEEPIAMSFFPAGDGEKNAVPFHMESDSVLVTAMKQQGENTLFHFFNAAPMPEEARIMWRGKKYTVSFNPYEVKFYCGTKDHLSETEFM